MKLIIIYLLTRLLCFDRSRVEGGRRGSGEELSDIIHVVLNK